MARTDVHVLERNSGGLFEPEGEGGREEVGAGEEEEYLSVGQTVDEVEGDFCCDKARDVRNRQTRREGEICTHW